MFINAFVAEQIQCLEKLMRCAGGLRIDPLLLEFSLRFKFVMSEIGVTSELTLGLLSFVHWGLDSLADIESNQCKS